MKFLANLCISPKTVKYLRKFGYEVYRVNEVDLRHVFKLLSLFEELPSSFEVTRVAEEMIRGYGFLPNDAIIVATCKYYGIGKIATFDDDFKRVDFLEIVRF